jgi:hypothetical protein
VHSRIGTLGEDIDAFEDRLRKFENVEEKCIPFEQLKESYHVLKKSVRDLIEVLGCRIEDNTAGHSVEAKGISMANETRTEDGTRTKTWVRGLFGIGASLHGRVRLGAKLEIHNHLKQGRTRG